MDKKEQVICNNLNKETIEGSLLGNAKNLPVFVYDEIDSTNTEATRLIREHGLKHGLLTADFQTAGRGRSGRSFFSPSHTGIYMSYVFTPPKGLEYASFATTKACVCVLDALLSYGFCPEIKWVNDIYIGGKKVVGILTEAITSGRNEGSVVVGIGINISTEDFPDEIKDLAGSLSNSSEVSKLPSRNSIIAHITNLLAEELNDLEDFSYIKKYRQHSMLTGKNITFIENEVQKEAFVLDVDDKAGLVVRLNDGTIRTLRNGEVNTLRPE